MYATTYSFYPGRPLDEYLPPLLAQVTKARANGARLAVSTSIFAENSPVVALAALTESMAEGDAMRAHQLADPEFTAMQAKVAVMSRKPPCTQLIELLTLVEMSSPAPTRRLQITFTPKVGGLRDLLRYLMEPLDDLESLRTSLGVVAMGPGTGDVVMNVLAASATELDRLHDALAASEDFAARQRNAAALLVSTPKQELFEILAPMPSRPARRAEPPTPG